MRNFFPHYTKKSLWLRNTENNRNEISFISVGFHWCFIRFPPRFQIIFISKCFQRTRKKKIKRRKKKKQTNKETRSRFPVVLVMGTGDVADRSNGSVRVDRSWRGWHYCVDSWSQEDAAPKNRCAILRSLNRPKTKTAVPLSNVGRAPLCSHFLFLFFSFHFFFFSFSVYFHP